MSSQGHKEAEAEMGDRKSFESVSTLPKYEEQGFGPGSDAAATKSSSPKPKRALSAAYHEIKSKISSSSSRNDESPEAAAERLAEKQRKKEERKEEYERLNLGDRTKYGWGGGVMRMSG